MANIILVTHWTHGDVQPFIRLGNEFRKEGHQVTLCTHCYYQKQARERGFSFIALDDEAQYESMNKELYQLTDPIKHREECIAFQLKYQGREKLLKEYEKIISVCKEPETIILARHRSSIAGLLVAEQLKLPYVSIVLAPNYLSHMELHNEIFGESLRQEINKVRKQIKLPDIRSWKDWLYSPKDIWGIWPEWFANEADEWCRAIHPIGFLPIEHTEACIDDRKIEEIKQLQYPFILISGGSSEIIDPLFYKIAIQACEQARCIGVVVTKYDKFIPKPLPRGIYWVKETNLPQLMTDASLIIHHGGMGTLNEAIYAGIPQIVLPHLTDGPDNASRLVALGIAKSFPRKRWDKNCIAKAINEMIVSDEIRMRCMLYKKANQLQIQKRVWIELINKVKPYEGEVIPLRSNGSRDVVPANKISPSRQQLLSILKRKKEEGL